MNPDLRAKNLVPHTAWLRSEPSAGDSLGVVFLLSITALAAILRFYHLTGQSLWVDEIMTWQMIRPGAGLNFMEQIRDAIQGPLYLALAWPLLRIQDSAFMLRLPMAIAGTLTVPLFALTVQHLFSGRTARLTGLLLALSPFHVWYSQEGRGYALLIFFAVAMVAVFLRILRDGITPSRALLFAFCSAAAVWSNMSGLFLWVALGMGLLLWDRPRTMGQWGLWLLAFGGGLVAVIPWLLKAAGIWAVDRLVVGNATGEALRGETTFTPLAIPYSVFTFFYGYSFGPSLRELHQIDKFQVIKDALPLLSAAAVPVVLGLGWGLARIPRKAWALVLWVIVPMLILAFLAVRNVKPWNPRYVAVSFPWLLALLGHGLSILPRRAGGILSLMLAGFFLFSLGGHFWTDRYAKANVRDIVEFVSAKERAGQDFPAIMAPGVESVFQYYYQGSGEILASYGHPILVDAPTARSFLEQKISGHNRILFLEARAWYFDPQGQLPGLLAEQGDLRLVTKTPGARLYSWQRDSRNKESNER